MKRSIVILSSVIAFFVFSSTSCGDDEPFVNIKAIESQIFNEIDAYRIANGIPDENPFVHQFVMVKEAQIFSAGMESTGLDTTGISDHWQIIHDKIGGYNDLTLIQATNEGTAAGIVANWTSDSTTASLMLKDYSQCGVGLHTGSDNVNYVTVLMMKVD